MQLSVSELKAATGQTVTPLVTYYCVLRSNKTYASLLNAF
jgi:hypothetical protein